MDPAATRPKRRLSVVSAPTSESSTVTLTNSPNGPLSCHDLPTHEPGRKRRKSVTFSSVAQVIGPECFDKSMRDVPHDLDSPHQTHRRPLYCSNSNLNASLSTPPASGWPIPNNSIEQVSIPSMILPNGYIPRQHDQVLHSVTGQSGLGANDVHAIYSTNEIASFPVMDAGYPPVKGRSSSSVQQHSISTPPKRVSFTPQSPNSSHSQSAAPFPSFPSLSHQYADSQNHDVSSPHCQRYPPQPQPQQGLPLPHTPLLQLQPSQRHESRSSERQPQSQVDQPQPRLEQPLVLLPSSKMPPREVCDGIDTGIRHSATLNCPTFDFTEHVRRRRYIIRKRLLSGQDGLQECVTMLDASVDALFPSSFPTPPPIDRTPFVIRPAFASLPSYSPLTHSSPNPISVNSKSIAKGLGMFALFPIASNQLISAEQPVVITPYIIALSKPVEEIYEKVFAMLGEETDVIKGRVEGLASFGERPSLGGAGEDEKKYESIMRVNALAIELAIPEGNAQEEHAELKTHKGMFLNTSRINHSCSPNAKWEWDLNTYSLVVTAVRPIDAGEEITIAYVPPLLPYHVRRDNLHAMYGFNCVCLTCIRLAGDSNSEEKFIERVRESDVARGMLTDFWGGSAEENRRSSVVSTTRPSFKQWCTDPSLPADVLISAHLQALGLIQRESLEILDTHPGPGVGFSVGSGAVSPERPSHIPNAEVQSPPDSDLLVHPLRDLGRHTDAIAMCYGALGDVENFGLWIGKAAVARGFLLKDKEKEWKEGVHGRDGKEVLEERLAFMKWMANPLSFPVWGWRNEGIRSGAQSIAVEPWSLDSDRYSPTGLRDCLKRSVPESA
ncbi:hypothetical protein GALMADRAFT_213677 [Galerina marginata CBS 339.88]|uniref:SET domain-containing protein n=1 Tax=Galerina marginata (strain CBS 339.88) TaxID=685588 RepID=A0A067SLR1_GALM3|nr:hypothetical protein GALMADRAFT_213677 [Galerina marginata CBS 339.88]